jgi:hypothetical protein
MTDMITPDMTVEFLDDVPEAGNPAPVSELACIVCDAPLTYGGRGPKPKYCDDHRKSGTKSAGVSKGNVALIERAINDLTSAYRIGSGLLNYVDQTSAQIVMERADVLGESYRPLLQTNKQFLELFAKSEKTLSWLPIIMAHGDLVVSIMLARKFDQVAEAANRAPDGI